MPSLTLRLDAYDEGARTFVHAAQSLADARAHAEVDPLHLLYVLVESDELVQESLRRAGVDPVDVLVEAELHLRRRGGRGTAGEAFLSARTLDILGLAERDAARARNSVATTDLLVALANEDVGAMREVMRATGLTHVLVRAAVDSVVRTRGVTSAARRGPPGTAPPAPRSVGSATAGNPPVPNAEKHARPASLVRGTLLSELCVDLVAEALDDRSDPVVGRDAELRRVLQVLARRNENNPLLVGEPGIGKTAIVRALAQRIAKRDVPSMLEGRKLVALDVGALVAGAKLRGQLEERMRALLAEIRAEAGGVILFVPSLGALTGAASAAGDTLAAALTRGEARVIATATPDEARGFVEEHAALSRRFVQIAVEPPTVEGTLAILRGLSPSFERDHGVRIVDPALVAASELARRYVQGVSLPKSAIDLIDEASARVRVERDSIPTELDVLERRLESLAIESNSLANDADAESSASRARIEEAIASERAKADALRARWEKERETMGEVASLERELTEARDASLSAGLADDLRTSLTNTTIPELSKTVDAARARLAPEAGRLVRDVVTAESVADVVASWTGVPVAKMLEEDRTKLLRMEETLSARVIGQDRAVRALSRAVRRGRVGLRDPKKPIGSFLFLGPTGVGKTELAKALADFLFDDEGALTRLDMSEFMEKHMVARLLGAPPGYVDSEAGGFLTEAVRRRPYSVVLFDEMEKAHPDVFNVLLQVLDDGRLTDSRGRTASFEDTVVILTSNVGSELVLDHEGTTEELRAKVRRELEARFRPEFLNRIDDIVIFDPLDRDELVGILAIELRKLERLLGHRRVGLRVSDAAKARLVDLGYEPAFGARPLKRAVQRELADPLAEELLRGGYAAFDVVAIDVEGERFTFTKTRP